MNARVNTRGAGHDSVPTITRRSLLLGSAAAIGLRECFPPVKAAAHAAPRLPLGERQLFLDDKRISRLENVVRVLHQPQKCDANPILRHDRAAWQQFRCQVYGTALFDPVDELIKLWYLAVPRLPFEPPVMVNGLKRAPNFQLVGYAESVDGIELRMPHLHQVNFNGSTENNLCKIGRECVEGIAIVRDEADSDANRRFKALYWEHHVPVEGQPETFANGMSVSFSADGKRWVDHANNPVIPLDSDTGQQAVYDAKRGRFIAYGRFGAEGRRLMRAESADWLNWTEPELSFETDDFDGPKAQVYGMGISIYEGVYIGCPWIFHEGTDHTIDVQLTMSRDGKKWSRVADRATFIPNGPPGAWDAGIVFTASQPIVTFHDELLIYYSGATHNHDFRRRPAPDDNNFKQYWDSLRTSIGVAKLRRDGFVSLNADLAPGKVTTKVFPMPPSNRLFVNANASKGAFRTKLLVAGDASITIESAVITSDNTRQQVQWSDSSRLPPHGTPVVLQFELVGCQFYSYWFEPIEK